MTDLSKYKAFPKGYVIPKGTEVIVISESRDSDSENYRKPGLKGITSETDNWPYCDWEDGKRMIHMESTELAPVQPQDHPDYKMETLYIDPSKPAEKREFNFTEPEWQPKTGEVVCTFPNMETRRIFLFKDNIGCWCVVGGSEDSYRKGMPVEIFCQKEVWQIKPEPLKLTRAEIAEKFGTDNFEIID